MEELLGAFALLDMLPRPAFCVKDGTIVKVNAAAASQLITAGLAIADLLQTGAEEYAAFQSGCLYLELDLGGCSRGYSVSRIRDTDLFHQEPEENSGELQAMALASRELRQSLAGIMATTEQLFPNQEVLPDPAAREQAARISRGLFQMLRIVGNMSDAGIPNASAYQEVRNIPGMMEELFSKASALLACAGISLRYTVCPEAVYALCDPQRLERAVLNILSNAAKFTPKGGSIDASLTHRGKMLYLQITDSGSGIAQELQGSFFTRYERAPGLEDSRFGIGLGFSLIRGAAAAHGGTVLVDQPEGKGTRVTLTLAIRPGSGQLRSPTLRVDYAGERDHFLVELSDVLPPWLYGPEANH